MVVLQGGEKHFQQREYDMVGRQGSTERLEYQVQVGQRSSTGRRFCFGRLFTLYQGAVTLGQWATEGF